MYIKFNNSFSIDFAIDYMCNGSAMVFFTGK